MDAARLIAGKVASIDASGIRRVFELGASLTDPVDLSIGQPDFDVPDPIKRAAIAAIEAGHNNYTVTQGLGALRERISAELAGEFNGWRPSVMVTGGVSGGLLLALMALLDPGDEVVYGDPYFVAYKALVQLTSGKSALVDLYDERFQPDPDRFAAAITPKTKLILLNSPGNPTGVVHEPERVKAIAELARRRDVLIISDEIYNMLSYDGRSPSPADFAPERTLLLRGFGKSYGMTGWRMGFAAGPAEIITEMIKLQQYTFVCAPHMAQRGVLAAFDTDMSATVRDYGRKRDLVTGELAGAFEFVRPSGGFYVFARAPKGYASGTAFVERCIANKVLVIPGKVFSERDTHFRISYAARDDVLHRGCALLRRLAEG